MHRVDAFWNSLGVCRKLVEGIGSLLGWRKGVRQKKTKTRWKIIRDSPKESGSSLGMRREIAGKKIGGLVVRLPEVIGVCGSKPSVSSGWTARTIEYGRRPASVDG
ncbi:hypothetical protein BHE74_00028914 [Ensete ventricosum]|nr:hypothetical protein BHE74_00028914 [Ensete ventricosum]